MRRPHQLIPFALCCWHSNYHGKGAQIVLRFAAAELAQGHAADVKLRRLRVPGATLRKPSRHIHSLRPDRSGDQAVLVLPQKKRPTRRLGYL